MDRDEIRRLMNELSGRVRLSAPGERKLFFDEPGHASLVSAGFESEAVRRMLGADWWPEMIEEVLETPDFCAPDDGPEEVLSYGRDVVVEHIRKRFEP